MRNGRTCSWHWSQRPHSPDKKDSAEIFVNSTKKFVVFPKKLLKGTCEDSYSLDDPQTNSLKQILSTMHSPKTNITYDSSDYHLMWNLNLKLVCADVRNSCFQFCYFFYFQSKSAVKWSGVHEKMLLPCTVKSIIPKQVTLHLPLSRCNVTDVRLKVSDLTVTGEPHIYENVFRIHGFIIVFSGCLESSKNWVQSLLRILEVPIQFLA